MIYRIIVLTTIVGLTLTKLQTLETNKSYTSTEIKQMSFSTVMKIPQPPFALVREPDEINGEIDDEDEIVVTPDVEENDGDEADIPEADAESDINNYNGIHYNTTEEYVEAWSLDCRVRKS